MRQISSLNKVLTLAALSFFVFILYIIYLANTGQSSIFFKLVASIPYGDKVGHLAIFTTLTCAANYLFNFRYGALIAGKLPVYWGTCLVLLFAAIEELSQYFVVSRTLDINDFFADLLGIIIATWLTHFIAQRRKVLNH